MAATNLNKFTDTINEGAVQKMLDSRLNLKKYVLENSRQGDIQNVIDTIDKFGWTQQWLMNIGDTKGKILDQAIQTKKPKTVLELGEIFLGKIFCYAICSNTVFLSVEADTQSAEIARSIFEHAGVTDRIQVINEYTDKVIPRLSKDFNIDSFDLIFIDHYKDVYLRDLKLLEENGLIKSGTMIVADNVICPGAPDYLNYIRGNPNYTTTFHETTLEYRNDIVDGVEISVRK
ncbi:unnamed protein product [Adineta ricciae]|uniref:catechol O-methyltransferase n=1 Tax=Adineta ricciae TaxID=249248 RepID=A0A813PJS6_ADIRI|nr:unnamed protein product [Adineta ricciae]CAF0887731.1 unnamed protein product [Adineta ricciae]